MIGYHSDPGALPGSSTSKSSRLLLVGLFCWCYNEPTMSAQAITVAPVGFDGTIVRVECDTAKGLPTLQIVGLAVSAML